LQIIAPSLVVWNLSKPSTGPPVCAKADIIQCQIIAEKTKRKCIFSCCLLHCPAMFI
jgi:hypothetical protein